MFQNVLPYFKRHSVLRAEVLTNGFVQNQKLNESLYAGYTDGIVEGAKVDIEDNVIVISPGVIKQDGMLYYSDKKEYITCEPSESVQYLYIRFWEEQQEENEIWHFAEAILTTEKSDRASDMELGRFLLKDGAQLRKDYVSLEDFKTEHNTFQILYAPYAGRFEKSISPEITRFYGKELLKIKKLEPMDAAFAMECLRGETIAMEQIVSYAENRLERKIDVSWSGVQGLDLFIELLNKAKESAQSQNERVDAVRRPRRMMLD